MIVPLPLNTVYKWLLSNGLVVNSSDVLKLIGNHTIDESKFTCLVNSPHLYSPIQKTITVTVQGMHKYTLSTSLTQYSTHCAGNTVSDVSISEDNISALKGTNNIIISCTITLNNTIGPDYSALNVTWTHNGSQSTMLQANSSGMSGKPSSMFTSVLTIDSNEFTDSGSYCCVAAVIGSGDSYKMDCVTLSVLGKINTSPIIKKSFLCTDISISGEHSDLTVGTTYIITCTVPGLDDSSAIMWTSSAAAVPVSITNTLTLQSVNNTLNGTEFTCSVNSPQLYSFGMKNISVTILGRPPPFCIHILFY